MKLFIHLNAILFLLYGIGFLLFPEYLSQIVTDASPSSTSGMIDMRATYGGISAGFGLLLFYMARTSQTLHLGLWAIILIVGGMAVGRLIGIVIDGSPNIVMYVFLALEIAVVGIGLRLLSTNTKQSTDA